MRDLDTLENPVKGIYRGIEGALQSPFKAYG